METFACPYCRESLSASAIKCPHCHEFLRKPIENGGAAHSTGWIEYSFTFFGKLIVPATILFLALQFRSTLESVLHRTKSAAFLGTTLTFSETRSFVGDLTPYELYYLLGSARNYGRDQDNVWLNYASLKKSGRDNVIYSLKNKGLVDFQIEQDSSSKLASQKILVTPTVKGQGFLIELGLVFDGRTFPDAP